MLFNLAAYALLVTNGYCRTFTTVDNLPTIEWDFIIIGGEHYNE